MNEKNAPHWPKIVTNSANSGTPMGTVMAMPWMTLALMTPRRVVALLSAKEKAAQNAKMAPSNSYSLTRPSAT